MIDFYIHQKDVGVAGVCFVMTKNTTELLGPYANIFGLGHCEKFCSRELKVDVGSGFNAVRWKFDCR